MRCASLVYVLRRSASALVAPRSRLRFALYRGGWTAEDARQRKSRDGLLPGEELSGRVED
jgi:hypothetical protein